MKKKLLIFLLDTNWYPLKSSKFEIKEFDKDSIKVKIHEMVDILNPELEKNFVNTTSSKHIKSFKKLNDWNNELLELVKEYEKENILIINDVRKINWNSLKINYLIKKMKIRTLELTNLDIPGYEFHNLRKSVIGLFSIKIKKVILNKIYLFLKQKFFAYLKLVFKFYLYLII